MFNVIIKNKASGKQTHSAVFKEQDDALAWINDCSDNGYWGESNSFNVEIIDTTTEIIQERIKQEADEIKKASVKSKLKNFDRADLSDIDSIGKFLEDLIVLLKE